MFMALMRLVYAPHPIFKMKAEPVAEVNDDIRMLVDDMFETMYFEGAVGMGANMVGVLARIAIVDLQKDGVRKPYTFINPEITWRSEEMQTFKEGSLCFPGIDADITRPKSIKISYTDYDGNKQELKAEDSLATVIQHEVDYLEGVTYLDYLSKMKRDMLLKKMQKRMKLHPPHVHGEHCNH